MAKDDDWYWACEPALVLADEDLGLCPAPDGWADEGLSCVGLYFYMLCVMHRSPRRGYLLDSNGLPLSTADLARLVRRPVDVVNRVQQVILTRKLFSVSTKGEIYSRGMVKRRELRLKRQASGSKGGHASILLKQNVKQTLEQNSEQTLTLDMDSDSCSESKSSNDSVSLGSLWVFHLARRKNRLKADDADDAQAVFDELQRVHGITEAALKAEIERKDRDRTEYLWQFKERLVKAKVNGTPTEPYSETIKRKLREARGK